MHGWNPEEKTQWEIDSCQQQNTRFNPEQKFCRLVKSAQSET
jgi:hypothetical protein